MKAWLSLRDVVVLGPAAYLGPSGAAVHPAADAAAVAGATAAATAVLPAAVTAAVAGATAAATANTKIEYKVVRFQ